MGVDSDAARIHHLELYGREAFPEHHFQIPAESIGGIGITHGRGFSEHKNSERSPRFFCRNLVDLRCLDHAGRKKWSREKQVVARGWSALHRARDGKVGRKSYAKQP